MLTIAGAGLRAQRVLEEDKNAVVCFLGVEISLRGRGRWEGVKIAVERA